MRLFMNRKGDFNWLVVIAIVVAVVLIGLFIIGMVTGETLPIIDKLFPGF